MTEFLKDLLNMKEMEEILSTIRSYVELFLLRKYLYGLEVTIFFAALFAAIKVRSIQGNKRFYWLKSLFLVVVTGFGGGMTAPVLLGRPPIFMTNDFILPCCIVAWYMTHYLRFQGILSWGPVQMICIFFAMTFKTHAICNTISLAHQTIPSSKYYPISLTGPIIAGVINGMMGLFYPLDKGLNPIANGTPWVIQGAIISSIFYHLMVNDTTGILGTTLRGYIGSYSEEEVRMMIACLWISCQTLQSLLGPSYNPFQPLYKVFYFLLQVDEPEKEIKSIPTTRPTQTQKPTPVSSSTSSQLTQKSDESLKKEKKRNNKKEKKVD